MKKLLKLLIPLVCLIGAVALILILDPFSKVIMNEEYVNGNTAGNLYNGGLFCEHDGTIYFSNPSDNGKLYSMDSNGNNLKKLSQDVATYINVDDNYIYYIRNNSNNDLNYSFVAFHTNALVRTNKNGKQLALLDTEPSLYAALLGNYIYYIHYDKEDASTLYKVCINGKEQKQVANEAIYTCNTDGQYFYYSGMITDGSIHRFDTSNDTSQIIYNGNTFHPIINGNNFYYIDGNANNAIVHTNLQFENQTYVTHDSVDTYNVHGDTIYYQRYDKNGSALCMVKTDGSEPVVIREGDYCDIHVTSKFVFFREYHSQDIFYFPHSNPENVKIFLPGTVE